MSVTAIVGTDKGAFLLRAGADRRDWTLDGPHFKGWKVTASMRVDGRYVLATASFVYGMALHVSDDLRTWRQIEHGPAWPKDSNRKLNQVWTLARAGGRLYAGVDEAGLFSSDDGGETWRPVDGLNEHQTRHAWYPGNGGLCAHAILVDPRNPDRVWVGISAVGVFRSDDGGRTFHPKNHGLPTVMEDREHKDIGYCVHGLAADPDDADVIYRREHVGVFRSRDGGETWDRIENGLGSWFGFPIAVDRRSRAVYVVPLESDEYRMPAEGNFRVYRSRDSGKNSEGLGEGLPSVPTFTSVLRGALAVDGQDPCGVYIGTTGGQAFASADRGDTWRPLPCTLPRILHVAAYAE